jgi:hypothetical protein
MNTLKKIVPLSKETASTVVIDLVPGFRNRLNVELAKLNIPVTQRQRFLSDITGRALQTVSRWIEPGMPGLPDLRSLAILCIQFGVDANWMLGLTQHRTAFLFDDLVDGVAAHVADEHKKRPDWIGALIAQAASDLHAWQVHVMSGDDMAPLINPGAAVFFDMFDTRTDANGTYVLDYSGQMLVRHIEVLLGRDLVLRCENMRYAPISVPRPLPGLKIMGKVKLVFNPVHF